MQKAQQIEPGSCHHPAFQAFFPYSLFWRFPAAVSIYDE
jgi:hypothetical protein